MGTGPAEPVRIMASGMPYLFTPAIYIEYNEKMTRKQRKETNLGINTAFLTPRCNPPFLIMAGYCILSSLPAEDEFDDKSSKQSVILAKF